MSVYEQSFFEVWKFKQVWALDIIGRMIRTCEEPEERTTVANETKWCAKTLTERRPRGKKEPLVLKTEGFHEGCGMWTMTGSQWPGVIALVKGQGICMTTASTLFFLPMTVVFLFLFSFHCLESLFSYHFK